MVALDSIRGQDTLTELSKQYELKPKQINGEKTPCSSVMGVSPEWFHGDIRQNVADTGNRT